GEVVTGVLRNLVNVGRIGTIGDMGEPRVARHGQRTPIVLRTEIALAPAGVELRHARLAALIGATEEDTDPAVGKGVADDARYFGCNLMSAERMIDDSLGRDAAAEPGPIERPRREDVDCRADAARRQIRSPRLV